MAQTKEEITAYNTAYYEANKQEIAAQKKAYYEANKEKIAAHKKVYREANKEEIATQKKVYREANKEKIAARGRAYYEANKEEIAAKDKAYCEANKEKITANSAKRRAVKRKQIPIHLRDCPQEKQRLTQTYRLSNILTEATGVQHHVDHMWPLSDGGPHWSGNLQVIPAKENLSKSASVCEETKATIIKSLYTFDTSSPI
tara:strand:+ start:1240 stop:1842 length:603 start_codon:yes stop_codon:yes gene_type:complete